MPDELALGGAVHTRGLVHLPRNGEEPGDIEDEVEAERLPDGHEDDGPDRRIAGGQPRGALESDQTQGRVEYAVQRVKDPEPHRARNSHRDHCWGEEHHAVEVAPARTHALHGQRQQQRHPHREHGQGGGRLACVDERHPERATRDQLPVVLPTDGGPRRRDEVPIIEAEHRARHERPVHEEAGEHDRWRQIEMTDHGATPPPRRARAAARGGGVERRGFHHFGSSALACWAASFRMSSAGRLPSSTSSRALMRIFVISSPRGPGKLTHGLA